MLQLREIRDFQWFNTPTRLNWIRTHSPIRLFLWHLETGTLFLLPSSQQLITLNPSRPASANTFNSYPILTSLLIFTIQGSTADYRDCTLLVQLLLVSISLYKKKTGFSSCTLGWIKALIKSVTFDLYTVLVQIINFTFIKIIIEFIKNIKKNNFLVISRKQK